MERKTVQSCFLDFGGAQLQLNVLNMVTGKAAAPGHLQYSYTHTHTHNSPYSLSMHSSFYSLDHIIRVYLPAKNVLPYFVT